MGTGRLEAFGNGVIAIITIMVLERSLRGPPPRRADRCYPHRRLLRGSDPLQAQRHRPGGHPSGLRRMLERSFPDSRGFTGTPTQGAASVSTTGGLGNGTRNSSATTQTDQTRRST